MTIDNHAKKVEWMRALLDRFEGPLVRYAAQITGNHELGRDVVQDTFLRLCAENRKRLEGHEAEWLYTVCRNRSLDVRKKESRHRPLNDLDLESAHSDEPSPSAALEKRETNNHVLQIMESLPENQREVIRLKFQNGLSYREISCVTKLSESNVGFLIHTAIKTIRTQLKAGSALAQKS